MIDCLSVMTPREDIEVSVVCAICAQTLTWSRKGWWFHPNGEVHWKNPGPDTPYNKMHKAKPAVKVMRTTITPIPEE